MISVCMASYNGADYIKAQIESVLKELGDLDELIISDDGSTDGTLDIISSFNDKRIRVFKNEGAHGIRGNFVNALKNARGEYIFLSDQDDVWVEGKVKTCMDALSGYDMVHHDSVITDENLKEIAPSLFEIKKNGPGVIKNMLKGSFYGSHMLITRKLLDLCFPFPEDDEVGHDLWIGIVASLKCKINYIPDKLIYYRRNDASHCDLFMPSKRPLSKKLWGRIVMLKYIIKFLLKRSH